jgi:CopG family nickel-responsive transcriptional regulator
MDGLFGPGWLPAALFAVLWAMRRTLPRPDDGWCCVPFAGAVGIFVLGFQGLAYSFFPCVVPERLTIWQAAAPDESLAIILAGAAVVLATILGDTAFAYRVFWGKARDLTDGRGGGRARPPLPPCPASDTLPPPTRGNAPMVQRLTISLDDDTAAAIDAFMVRRGYTNRSEAVRDLVRSGLAPGASDAPGGLCVAAVSYVYDHHERDLVRRLADAQHDHHDLVIATMHAHLDHHECLEVVLMRGRSDRVRRVAEATVAERGVRFGQANVVPVTTDGNRHRHDDGGPEHEHATPALAALRSRPRRG